MSSPADIHRTIANALAILATPGAREPHAVSRNFEMAVEALIAAKAAIEERDAELDSITSPGSAAEQIQSLRKQLEAAESRLIQLEQEEAMRKQEAEIEQAMKAEEEKKRRANERKARDLDTLLMNDKEAFAKYMDQAMDEHERKHGKPRRS